MKLSLFARHVAILLIFPMFFEDAGSFQHQTRHCIPDHPKNGKILIEHTCRKTGRSFLARSLNICKYGSVTSSCVMHPTASITSHPQLRWPLIQALPHTPLPFRLPSAAKQSSFPSFAISNIANELFALLRKLIRNVPVRLKELIAKDGRRLLGRRGRSKR